MYLCKDKIQEEEGEEEGRGKERKGAETETARAEAQGQRRLGTTLAPQGPLESLPGSRDALVDSQDGSGYFCLNLK